MVIGRFFQKKNNTVSDELMLDESMLRKAEHPSSAFLLIDIESALRFYYVMLDVLPREGVEPGKLEQIKIKMKLLSELDGLSQQVEEKLVKKDIPKSLVSKKEIKFDHSTKSYKTTVIPPPDDHAHDKKPKITYRMIIPERLDHIAKLNFDNLLRLQDDIHEVKDLVAKDFYSGEAGRELSQFMEEVKLYNRSKRNILSVVNGKVRAQKVNS